MPAARAKIEAGHVHLPNSAPWLGEFLTELLSFPNGRHDDQVDSVSQFLRWLQNDAYQNPHCAQVGAEGWCRSNKRMGLPDTTSRTVYKIREAEAPILSATITVMKKISFRSIFLRPSYCARPIWSPDFKPLCYRWNRPIFWATLTMETKRKPSRILIRKFGESHQKPCSGSSYVPVRHYGGCGAYGYAGYRRPCRPYYGAYGYAGYHRPYYGAYGYAGYRRPYYGGYGYAMCQT